MSMRSLTTCWTGFRRALARWVRSPVRSWVHPPGQVPAGEANVDVLDVSVFEELRESLNNKPDVVANIYRHFLISALTKLRELDAQPAAAQMPILHMLKGSAAMVGADRFAQAAERLHASLLYLPTHATDGALRELENELRKFQRALAVHIQSLGWTTAL